MLSKKALITLFSLLGLTISLYLTYVKLTSSPIRCGFGSCEVVQNSVYSQIFGIPVAVFGVVFYLALFCFNYYEKSKLLRISVWVGFLFSLYLTFIELFVIHAICMWCVASAILATSCFVLVWSGPVRQPAERPGPQETSREG